jgi:hypothetical protein
MQVPASVVEKKSLLQQQQQQLQQTGSGTPRSNQLPDGFIAQKYVGTAQKYVGKAQKRQQQQALLLLLQLAQQASPVPEVPPQVPQAALSVPSGRPLGLVVPLAPTPGVVDPAGTRWQHL